MVKDKLSDLSGIMLLPTLCVYSTDLRLQRGAGKS